MTMLGNTNATANRGILRTPSDSIPPSPLRDAVYAAQLARGLTDEEMGDITGMGRTHYTEFRRGTREISTLRVARRLHERLKIPATLFF